VTKESYSCRLEVGGFLQKVLKNEITFQFYEERQLYKKILVALHAKNIDPKISY
jgi:hypothetical protein